jgi:hypothetical protein
VVSDRRRDVLVETPVTLEIPPVLDNRPVRVRRRRRVERDRFTDSSGPRVDTEIGYRWFVLLDDNFATRGNRVGVLVRTNAWLVDAGFVVAGLDDEIRLVGSVVGAVTVRVERHERSLRTARIERNCLARRDSRRLCPTDG